jgi:hypothetical protein
VKSGAFSQKTTFFFENFLIFSPKKLKIRKTPEMVIFDKIPISPVFPKTPKIGGFCQNLDFPQKVTILAFGQKRTF